MPLSAASARSARSAPWKSRLVFRFHHAPIASARAHALPGGWVSARWSICAEMRPMTRPSRSARKSCTSVWPNHGFLSGRYVGVDLLRQWRHPVRGSPAFRRNASPTKALRSAAVSTGRTVMCGFILCTLGAQTSDAMTGSDAVDGSHRHRSDSLPSGSGSAGPRRRFPLVRSSPFSRTSHRWLTQVTRSLPQSDRW